MGDNSEFKRSFNTLSLYIDRKYGQSIFLLCQSWKVIFAHSFFSAYNNLSLYFQPCNEVRRIERENKVHKHYVNTPILISLNFIHFLCLRLHSRATHIFLSKRINLFIHLFIFMIMIFLINMNYKYIIIFKNQTFFLHVFT